jgi:hypothetical protein
MDGEEQAKPESLFDYGYTAFDKWDYRPFVHSVGFSSAPFDGNSGCRSISGLTTIRFIGSTKASQSADTGGDRNQVRPLLRSAVPPSRGRLIGTLRRECLDPALFWTTADLEVSV